MQRVKSEFFLVLLSAFFILNFSELIARQDQSNIQTKEEILITHVVGSIDNAMHGISQLNEQALSVHGYSSPTIRHFLNNLCSLQGSNYLEIGCWKGSTLVAALYKNEKALSSAIAIDNWSEFGGSKLEFTQNIQAFIPDSPLKFYEEDCFAIDKSKIFHEPINIYFYDARHEQSDQKAAFTYYDCVFDDVFIAVVDDWNWNYVRDGTFSAFEELGYQILFERPFFTGWNGDTSSWWNGLYIAVIKKQR